jgi:hypothetical protein
MGAWDTSPADDRVGQDRRYAPRMTMLVVILIGAAVIGVVIVLAIALIDR